MKKTNQRICPLVCAAALTFSLVGGYGNNFPMISAATEGETTAQNAESTYSFISNTEAAYTKYGWVTTPATVDEAYRVTVGITLAGDTKETTFTSLPLNHYNPQSYVYEGEAVAELLCYATVAEIIFNAKGEVIDFERIERGFGPGAKYEYYLDSQLFGGELTAPGGDAGNMVAQGWVLEHTDSTITVGDGNHVSNVFEETYRFADDMKVYLVNNPGVDEAGNAIPGDFTSVEGSVADIIDNAKNADGEIYGIGTRRTAMAVFNESAVDPSCRLTRRDDVSSARVTELYLYKNMTPISSTTPPDDVGYNGTSWMPGQDKTLGKTSFGWNGIATPFEVLADRLYSCGDTFTNVYLFVSDPDENGKKTYNAIDGGNAIANYGYWLNYWKVGYDPRQLDNMLLTHGHGDHYESLYELSTMVNRAAGYDKLNVLTCIADKDGYISERYVGLTLTAKPERYVLDGYFYNNEWLEMGGGVSLYPMATPGHANDASSFIFKLTTTPNDKYFTDGPVTTAWVYMGGYGGGQATRASNGYRRLDYRFSMMYLQSVAVPFAESVADYVYNIPQHGDQAPWFEVAKAVRQLQSEGKDITFLDAWNEGSEGITNLFEKRLSAYAYQWMNSAWKETQATEGKQPVDLYDQIIVPYISGAGYDWYCTPQNKDTEAQETYGPWKRETGTYKIDVKSVQVLHGFDAFQNKNSNLAGIKNIYGWDISNGLSVDRDSYSHDPNGWYVQVVAKVDDDYAGGVYFSEADVKDYSEKDRTDYPQNWYLSSGNAYKDFKGAEVLPESGAVESMSGTDWTEILRTQRLNTEAEARQLAAYIQENLNQGKTGFMVEFNRISDIKLPNGYISSANAPFGDKEINSLNDASIKKAFPGTGYYSLEEEAAIIERAAQLNQAAGIDVTTMFTPAE